MGGTNIIFCITKYLEEEKYFAECRGTSHMCVNAKNDHKSSALNNVGSKGCVMATEIFLRVTRSNKCLEVGRDIELILILLK